MSGATTDQTMFQQGLRGSLPEQLGTVAKLSRLFEENPAPTFVNPMLLTVAEAFKDGNLDLRIAIVRALSQCGSHLTLAFSTTEIFRRILTVSHSNDPNARETVLDVLAVLAPLMPESHQSHHFIQETLRTEHEAEFRAACRALKSFASLSQSFAESIVLQIGKILEDDRVSEDRKVLLCAAFSTMSATAQVVELVFSMAETVLRRTTADEYFMAFLESTTSLCIEIRYSIPKQIDLLLSHLHPSDRDRRKPTRTRKLIVLRELRRLSKFSNLWTEKQVKTFVSTLSLSLTERSLTEFFDTAINLTRNCPHSNLVILKKLILTNTGYGSSANPEVSVRFVRLAAQVVCTPKVFEADQAEFVEAAMTSLAVVVVNTCTCGKLRPHLASRLFRSIGDLLLAFPYSEHSFSLIILSAIFSAFDSPVFNDKNQKERLDMLCRLADSDKRCIGDIHVWACGVMRNKKGLFEAYPSQFSYLCLAVGTKIPGDFPKVLYPNSQQFIYETARSAFRNGHWKSVAAPNLAALNVLNLPKSERDWISALRELAASQVSEMSLEALEEQQTRLYTALSILKTSRTNPNMEKTVQFPINLISAMLSTSNVLYHLLSIVLPFSTYLSGALQPNAFFNPIVAKRFLAAIIAFEPAINEAISEWSALCSACFCADPTSTDLITLYYSRVYVIQVLVRVIIRKQQDTLVQIPPLTNDRTCSTFQRERLQWVIDKVSLLRYEAAPTANTIKTFLTLLEPIVIMPYMLPRFFFQQFYNVDFKISITPQPEKDQVSVMPGETVPIRIDGAIISSHPSPIRSVVVYADVTDIVNHANNQTFEETVDPSESNYFTAQFLLTLRMSSDIKFRIEFIDQTSRKRWKADGSKTLQIEVRKPPPPPPPPHEIRRPDPIRSFVRSSMFYDM